MGRHAAPAEPTQPEATAVAATEADAGAATPDRRSPDPAERISPAPVPTIAQPADPTIVQPPEPTLARPAASRTWRDRSVLAGAAALSTGAVMAWAGTPPAVAVAGALAGGLVVALAAWVASTVPSRPTSAHAQPAGGAAQASPIPRPPPDQPVQ